ncbi:MAG: thioredoxin family protein [Thermoanaerobaculia bacterium]
MTSLHHRAPRLLAIALLAVLPTAACSRPEAPAGTTIASGNGISFSTGGFDEALARARDEKRLLLVDIYTDWCGWCKKLDREVFADGRVGAAAKDLVAVKVNAEKGGEEIARRYRVRGYPTILFLDGEGKVVERIDGYVDAREMVKIVSALPKG